MSASLPGDPETVTRDQGVDRSQPFQLRQVKVGWLEDQVTSEPGGALATLEPQDLEHRRAPADLSAEERRAIEQLIDDRTQARGSRDWPRADQIRAELDELGVTVTDTPEGPTWHLR